MSDQNANDAHPSRRGGLLWCFLFIGLFLLGFTFFSARHSGERIIYSDLIKLIERSKRDAVSGQLVSPEHASIIVAEERRGQKLHTTYSNLHDVRVGIDQVTGRVNRLEAGPQDPLSREGKVIAFHTNLVATDEAYRRVVDALEKNNIPFGALRQTSWLQRYGWTICVPFLLLFLFLWLRGGVHADAAQAERFDDDSFVDLKQCSQHEIFPGVHIQTMAGQQIMLSLVEMQPHAVVQLHSHPHEQVGMLLEGELTFTIGGEKRTLRPGQMWRIPGGVPHTAVAGDQPVKALDVFCPVREEYL
jgi:quercetin dioxygenase-like cupin family protein